MVHTFDITVEINHSEFISFRRNFKLKEKAYTPFIDGVLYYSDRYSKKGINRLMLIRCTHKDPVTSQNKRKYYIKLSFNLAALMGDNRTFLAVETHSTQEIIDRLYKVLQEIPELSRLKIHERPVIALSPNRFDFAEDIIVPDPHLIAFLLNMSMPYNYYKMKRVPIKKPLDIVFRESCSFSNKSRAINFYCKYDELISKGTFIPPEDEERLKHTFRFEIQCKKRSIKYLVSKLNGNKNIEPLLEETYCRKYITEQVNKIFKPQRYVSESKAMSIIDNSSFSRSDKDVMKSIVRNIHNHNGLYKLEKAVIKGSAPVQYGNLKQFRKYLSKIRDLGIQPVTIPDSEGVTEIPSLADLINNERTDYYV